MVAERRRRAERIIRILRWTWVAAVCIVVAWQVAWVRGQSTDSLLIPFVAYMLTCFPIGWGVSVVLVLVTVLLAWLIPTDSFETADIDLYIHMAIAVPFIAAGWFQWFRLGSGRPLLIGGRAWRVRHLIQAMRWLWVAALVVISPLQVWAIIQAGISGEAGMVVALTLLWVCAPSSWAVYAVLVLTMGNGRGTPYPIVDLLLPASLCIAAGWFQWFRVGDWLISWWEARVEDHSVAETPEDVIT